MRHIDDFIKYIKCGNNQKDYFPLHEPIFNGNEKKYVLEAIDSTFVSSVGKMIINFEKNISEYTNIKYSIACVNGTAALHTCLIVGGIKKDEEVITQALSFVATANAISYIGAKPIFIDVDLDTMGMSPIALENFLEENVELRKEGSFNKKSGNKIAACIPMHTFGFMCRIDQIKQICKKWKILLIEDAAEALGSKYKGKSSGSFGTLSAFSFNGNKIITSGGGGCLVTKNKILSKKAMHITTTAKSSSNWEYIHDNIGYNYRMPNINAALAVAQLEKLDEKILKKMTLYNLYKENFSKFGIELVSIPKETSWNYWLMSIKLSDKRERDFFLEKTNNKSIFTRPTWRLLYKLPMYSNCQKDSQKNANFLEKTIVNIPSNLVDFG